MCLHAIEPQHVVSRGRKAATDPRIRTPDSEPHGEKVVVVYAVSVPAPWRAALQPWLQMAERQLIILLKRRAAAVNGKWS